VYSSFSAFVWGKNPWKAPMPKTENRIGWKKYAWYEGSCGMHGNIVFIVSSCIYVAEKPLCYTETRSLFSAEERAEQTVNTIRSIREKVPSARILLVESGLEASLPAPLHQMADSYLYLGNKSVVREAADSLYKGIGEVVGLLLANRRIRSMQADYYFKMSGRYVLNDYFTPGNWTKMGFFAKKLRPDWTTTVLYGFSDEYYDDWRTALKKCIPLLLQEESLERALPMLAEFEISNIDVLGISGQMAPDGIWIAY
jgi:hypothetical protein